MAQDGHTISWEVETHTHRERSNDWYWGLGLAAGAGALIAIFFGNVLFAVILILGGASIGILTARGPRTHGARLDSRGISIDGTLYRYNTIRSFWVDEEREWLPEEKRHPHLYLTTTSVVAPHITLPLESRVQAEQVRSFLKKYVKEEERGPHFGEHIAELFGL